MVNRFRKLFDNYSFVEMKPEELDPVVELISNAINEEEAIFARKSIEFSFFCKKTHGQ